MRFYVLACMSVGSVVTASAAPLINAASQLRQTEVEAVVSGSEAIQSDTDFEAAADFGPFLSDIDASASLGSGGGSTNAGSEATQESYLMANAVSGRGHASAGADPNDNYGSPSADASSFFSFDFTISQTLDVLVSGNLDAYDDSFGGGGESFANFELSGPGGALYSVAAFDSPETLAFAATLAPGAYQIIASATASASDPGALGDASFLFDVQFVPEPATGLLVVLGLIALRRR